jgi:hypothetical protein
MTTNYRIGSRKNDSQSHLHKFKFLIDLTVNNICFHLTVSLHWETGCLLLEVIGSGSSSKYLLVTSLKNAPNRKWSTYPKSKNYISGATTRGTSSRIPSSHPEIHFCRHSAFRQTCLLTFRGVVKEYNEQETMESQL